MNKYPQDKQPPKILVIDDNSLFLETLLELLDANGFQALGAQKGLLGLQFAQAHRPDVIICDINMPALNGYEVLTKLRQNSATAKIPFIFMTAAPINNIQSLVREMGVNGYLTKPFSTSQLILTIKAQLESNEAIEN